MYKRRGVLMSEQQELTAKLRVRLSASDAHYGGQLVNGAHMLSLFGDVATELAILCDGDEGLLVSYERISCPVIRRRFCRGNGAHYKNWPYLAPHGI
jgi:hypothetical protein